MRVKSLLLIAALCGAFVSASAAKKDAKAEELGVHPYQETENLACETTGFSLIFHGGVNVWNGDYPTDEGRFTNFVFSPDKQAYSVSAGLNLEYNFTPVWGIGLGYTFAMPNVKANRDEAFTNFAGEAVKTGDIMYQSLMHRGQVYLTFDIINAWFPRAVTDVFGLNLFAGIGGTMYKNKISFKDSEETGDSKKYQADAPATKYETVGFVPLGASAEFNVSRGVAIGARFQYNMFLNDYVDNRYLDRANKRNDGMYDVELLLRWKIAAKKKNHLANVSSHEVLEEKYYQSHPNRRKRPHVVDTLVVYHRDTIVVIQRDTVVMAEKKEEAPAPVVAPKPAGRCDLEFYPGWESEAVAVVVEGQSLSQLSRKYYKNTFCWVYLWLANRSVAPDPNLILPKCVLKVPKLNDCQKSITKQEAKDMAARYRGE